MLDSSAAVIIYYYILKQLGVLVYLLNSLFKISDHHYYINTKKIICEEEAHNNNNIKLITELIIFTTSLIAKIPNRMDIIELDIGGKIFRTTKNTLCSIDSFFKRMLENGNWKDGKDDVPIFIDRDPTTFHAILSYLRSGRFFFTGEDDNIFLEMLLLEADFYHLLELYEVIKQEIENREKNPEQIVYKEDIQKVVSVKEVNSYLSRGNNNHN